MFVRIVRPTIDKVIECEGYEMQNHQSNEPGTPDYITLELRPDRGAFSITKETGNEIYIMNDSGKTIDRYRWA